MRASMWGKKGLYGTALCCFVLLAGLALAEARAAKDVSIGRLIQCAGTAWADRNTKVPLAMNSPMYREDVVQTGDASSLKIQFGDTSTVSLAASSRIRLDAYEERGEDSRFAMQVLAGLSRIVTGQIVKDNEKGFSVTTAEATVGIRGTDCTVIREEGKTLVVVNKIANKEILLVNTHTREELVLTKRGQVAELTAKGSVLRDALPAELDAGL